MEIRIERNFRLKGGGKKENEKKRRKHRLKVNNYLSDSRYFGLFRRCQ
jgi:hypothetical protein